MDLDLIQRITENRLLKIVNYKHKNINHYYIYMYSVLDKSGIFALGNWNRRRQSYIVQKANKLVIIIQVRSKI